MSDGATSVETGGSDTGGSEVATPAEVSAAPDLSGSESTAAPAERDVAGDAVAAAKAADEVAARKWALRYDGKDHEVTSEEELIKLAQKGLGADKRFEEAATTRKEAEALKGQIEQAARRMADDPLSIMAAIHGDEGRAAQIAAKRMLSHPAARAEIERMLLETYEYEGLPEADRKRVDEERMLREKASRADRYEAEERKRAEAAKVAEREKAQAVEIERLQRTYAEEAKASLTAAGLDPNDPDTAERWIMQRMAAMDQGVELTAAEAAQRVAEKLNGSRKGWIEGLGKLDGDALLSAIPKGVLDKIRAADAARITGAQRARARAVQTGEAAPPKPRAPKREYSSDQYLRATRTLGWEETQRRMDAGEPLDA